MCDCGFVCVWLFVIVDACVCSVCDSGCMCVWFVIVDVYVCCL